MAPTLNENVAINTVSLMKRSTYWTKTNIAFTAVFAAVAVGIVLGLVAFLVYRQKQKKHAKVQADRAALLDNKDKESMFSRQRDSQSTLRPDFEAEERNRTSQDITQHTPLHITPAENISDSMSDPTRYTPTTTSTGSGVSALSRTTDTNSTRYTMLSPISPATEGVDLGITVTTNRPRSTSSTGRPRIASTASQRRYYDVTPSSVELPPIPKIVHTASD